MLKLSLKVRMVSRILYLVVGLVGLLENEGHDQNCLVRKELD